MKLLNVTIENKDHKALKVRAAKENKTISSIIREMIKEYLKEDE